MVLVTYTNNNEITTSGTLAVAKEAKHKMKKIITTLVFINVLVIKIIAQTTDTLYVTPNPCDSVASIHFAITQARNVSLNVYNRWGQNIKTVYTNVAFASGTYQVEYNTDSLPDENYLVRLDYDTLHKNSILTKIKTQAQSSIDTLYVNPNPCDSLATIHFTLNQNDSVTIFIYNRWGQLIQQFYANTFLTNGAYSVNYITDSLPNDVYFLKLQGNTSSRIYRFIKDITPTVLTKKVSATPLTIYPNPSANNLTINYTGIKKIELLTLQGKIIISQKTIANTIDIAQLPIGTYLINVYDDNGVLLTTQKIMKAE